jgi:hypothetical protein
LKYKENGIEKVGKEWQKWPMQLTGISNSDINRMKKERTPLTIESWIPN